MIVSEKGSELKSKEIMNWVDRKKMEWKYIENGKKIKKELIERLNGKIREEIMNEKLLQ